MIRIHENTTAAMTFSYRISDNHRKKIEEYVDRGEYQSIAAFIDEAIIYQLRYLEERDFRSFLMTEAGKARIHELLKENVKK